MSLDRTTRASAGAQSPVAGTGPGLTCEGVVAGYGEVPVLHGVSLTAPAGRVLAVVGPNGAGKSTLLRALLGLVRVREGRVQLGGRDITNRPLEELARGGVGYVPQGDDVFDTLRVSENLGMGGFMLPRAARKERADAVLEVFPALRRLTRRYAGTLSGGERKMVALARVLMPDPAVLLLDEPTAGLAVELTRMVLEQQVRLLADLGKAVVLVEQKAEAALKVADDAAVLVRGAIELTGTGAEVLGNEHVAEIFLGGGGRSSGWSQNTWLGADPAPGGADPAPGGADPTAGRADRPVPGPDGTGREAPNS